MRRARWRWKLGRARGGARGGAAVTLGRLLLQMVLGIVLPLAAQLLDRRQLDAEQRARAWNGASWGAALYAFSVFSMLGWYWVTRRGWRRLVYGPLATVALIIVLEAADFAFRAVTGSARP